MKTATVVVTLQVNEGGLFRSFTAKDEAQAVEVIDELIAVAVRKLKEIEKAPEAKD